MSDIKPEEILDTSRNEPITENENPQGENQGTSKEEIEVEEGLTILKAAKKLGIKIPSLCYPPDIPPTSA